MTKRCILGLISTSLFCMTSKSMLSNEIMKLENININPIPTNKMAAVNNIFILISDAIIIDVIYAVLSQLKKVTTVSNGHQPKAEYRRI